MKISVKLNIEEFFSYGLALSLLLGCSSVYSLIDSKAVMAVIAIFSVFYLLYTINRQGLRKKTILVLLLYSLLAILVVIFVINPKRQYWVRYYLFMPCFIILTCCLRYEQKVRFMEVMERIIFFLVVTSLILWVLGPIMHIISPTKSYNVEWGRLKTYYSYFGLLFTEQIQRKTIFGISILRNLSIYPEGPFSNVIFSLGLVIYLLTHELRNKLRVTLYLMAILTTLSSTGWGMAVVIISVDYLYRESQAGKQHRINELIVRYVIPIIIVFAGVCTIYLVLSYKEATDLRNYLAHVNPLRYGVSDFLSNPWNGAGMGKSKSLHNNFTSGIFRILGDGGIILGAIHFIPIILVFCKSGFGKKNFKLAFFDGFILIMLILVVWERTLLFFFILAMGYSLILEEIPSKMACSNT